MIAIVNCHYQECDFYCGRKWNGHEASPLGNPFRGPDAIERYGRWLWAQIQDRNKAVLNALRVIHDNHGALLARAEEDCCDDVEYRLGCWCHPKNCHCSEIIAALQCAEVIAILDESMPF